MKHLLFILIFAFSSVALATPTRFKIHNAISGNDFTVEKLDGIAPQDQPEWGKCAREDVCDSLGQIELARVLSRRTVTDPIMGTSVDFCQLPDQFTIVTEDMTTEVSEKIRKDGVRSARLARLVVLAKKDKAGTITAAERNEALGLMARELAKTIDDTID